MQFNMKAITLVLAVILAMASVALAQSQKEAEQIEVSVLAVMMNQAAAWNRGDIEGFMAGYWRSDALVFVSGDKVTRGWQATLSNYKSSYNTAAKMGKLAFTDIEVAPLSKDSAVVLGSWALTRDADNPKGKFTLIFRRLKEGWRIIHDHTS